MGLHPVLQFYRQVLQPAFPPVKCAFAYGSAVFHQQGRAKGKILDLVFAVDDPESWHKENLERNGHHYSFLRYIGSQGIARIQRAPAGVYYNTLVQVDSQMLKYGVISVEDMLDDLLKWKWLYISGRLHKPVMFLTDLGHLPAVEEAVHRNIFTALYCAVLMMEDNKPFSTKDLFIKVAGLSYEGDFRMVFGEDKRKVHNIVQANIPEFEKLYSSFLPDLVEFLPDDQMIRKSNVSLKIFQNHLPEAVQERLHYEHSLQGAIRNIVRSSSIQQSLKGILTAGMRKALVYSYEKLTKMTGGMR